MYKFDPSTLQGIDLVLVRGAQGAGKSTFATNLAERHGYLLLEPDDFYYAGPHYFWDKAWLAVAHRWNRWRTHCALMEGRKVIVAETFYLQKHLHPYTAMTPHHQVIRLTGEFENIHGVTPEVVQNVRDRMQPYNGEIILSLRNG